MTTSVTSPKKFQSNTSKESPFDEPNSLLAVTIYHERSVRQNGSCSMKYYLKKKVDAEHDNANQDKKFLIELIRSVRLVENKLTSKHADNKMVGIHIYFNDNKAGTVVETKPNPLLCKLIIMRNGSFQPTINKDLMGSNEAIKMVGEIMLGWQQAIERSR